MGYVNVIVRGWVNEGEHPSQGLPPYISGGPGSLPPSIGGGPVYPPYYPDNTLPGGPNYPSQGLPPYIWGGPGSLPGGGNYPSQEIGRAHV